MSTYITALIIDHLVLLITFSIATAASYRLIGPQPGADEKIDRLHAKWIRHFKWLGPICIMLVCVKIGFTIFTNKQTPPRQTVASIHEKLSAEGKLATQDEVIAVSDGFKILIPKDYTYHKPANSPHSMIAIADVEGDATPSYSVAALKQDGNLEQYIETVKQELIRRNSTTNFTPTRIVETTWGKLFRTTMKSERANGHAKGELAFFESSGKVFMLTYATRLELFETNATCLENIIASFGPA